jgi:hypothetical protein
MTGLAAPAAPEQAIAESTAEAGSETAAIATSEEAGAPTHRASYPGGNWEADAGGSGSVSQPGTEPAWAPQGSGYPGDVGLSPRYGGIGGSVEAGGYGVQPAYGGAAPNYGDVVPGEGLTTTYQEDVTTTYYNETYQRDPRGQAGAPGVDPCVSHDMRCCSIRLRAFLFYLFFFSLPCPLHFS